MSGRARNHGYTLVELIVVLGILGLLASMVLPLAEVSVQRDRERELKRALWEIRDAIDAYKRLREGAGIAGGTGVSNYPPDLLALTLPVADPRAERRGEVHRFLRRVPRDPFADPALPAERTWGLRSYLSDADKPQAGADVFDVYSLSERTGLNGVPLQKW
jgi:general secretion pathway protein G